MKKAVTYFKASAIITRALADHGSHSQCDHDHLMATMGYRGANEEQFTEAADRAASDLCDC